MLNYLSILTSQQLTQAQLTTLLNMSDLEEVEARAWARLKVEITINSFALLSVPSVTVTQGSTTVTNNSGTFPAVTAQFVVSTSGQPYAPIPVVANASASSTLTLVNPYPAPSSGTASLSLFPMFYSATDGFGTILQQVIGVRQTVPLIRRTHEWINLQDSYRAQTSSPANFWAPAGFDVNDVMQFEMWPIETVANAYVVYGLKGHIDMVNPTDVPAAPSGVVMQKAMMKSCETLYALTGDSRWTSLRDFYAMRYDVELQKALDEDKEQFGVIAQVQDSAFSAEGSGKFVPGLDVLFNRDAIGDP